ncbi:MAG: hypothetical protein D6731_04985 [Planctomycetota bacterium]|nr:MAG: hypothetical protein D6731_04985 [Planctomycetota bacterium]
MRALRLSWSSSLVVLALVLGCASSPGVAQERRAPESRPGGAGSGPRGTPKSGEGKKEKKKEQDPTRYQVKVTDKPSALGGAPAKPFVVRDVVVFVPEVTLFGGGSGEEVKKLVLRRGSAQVTIPFKRIAVLEFGEPDEDRLPVTVTLKGVEGPAAKLKGTVKASLELRGKLGATDLDSVVRLRDTRRVEFSVLP